MKFFNVTKTTDNTMNFLKNVDGLYDFYTEQDKTFDGSIKALKMLLELVKIRKSFQFLTSMEQKL